MDNHAVGITVFKSDGQLVSELDAEVISQVWSTAIFAVELNSLRFTAEAN